jgi:hypothetical protein
MNSQPAGPLARRIAARKGQPCDPKQDRRMLVVAEPIHKPAWIERLTARDDTGRLS